MSHSCFWPQLKRLLQYAVNLILYRYEVDLPSSSALLRRSGAIELSWYSWRCGSAKFQSILLHRRVKTVLGGYGSIDGDSESLWSEGRPRLSEIKCMSNLSNRCQRGTDNYWIRAGQLAIKRLRQLSNQVLIFLVVYSFNSH